MYLHLLTSLFLLMLLFFFSHSFFFLFHSTSTVTVVLLVLTACLILSYPYPPKKRAQAILFNISSFQRYSHHLTTLIRGTSSCALTTVTSHSHYLQKFLFWYLLEGKLQQLFTKWIYSIWYWISRAWMLRNNVKCWSNTNLAKPLSNIQMSSSCISLSCIVDFNQEVDCSNWLMTKPRDCRK